MNTVASHIIATLAARGETLCVAESLTGGGVGEAITAVPGASKVFLGGVIAYSVQAKIEIIAVPPALIEECGVVSEEVAVAMAQGARKLFGATWAIATTGVAGPGAGDGVPEGTVWLAIAGPLVQATLLALDGEREAVRNATISSALSTFSRILKA